MSDHTKSLFDWLSLGTAVSTIMGWLPPLAALLAIVWTLIQIYESKTFKRFVNWVKT